MHKDSPLQDARRRAEERQGAQLRHRRPELDLGLPGARLTTCSRRTRSTTAAHFKTVRNASHEANILAVLAKQVDVATNNTEELDKLKATQARAVQARCA